MDPLRASLDWIGSQQTRMVTLLREWCEINSGSRNLAGLAAMSLRLQTAFASLGGQMCEIELPPETTMDPFGQLKKVPLGKAISIRKRPIAPIQAFLGIHMDTVYGLEHPLQKVRQLDDRSINGPGVADAKGGLLVMLFALEAFERLPVAANVGWEILINPDEELGSPGSASLLAQCAERNHFGMVFEPAHADGALVGERKGSGNFVAVLRGRSAHAGRDFHLGRNAIHAGAKLVTLLDQINRANSGVTINVGKIDGGGPTNIVPDLAIIRFNVRLPARQNVLEVERIIQAAVDQVAGLDGIKIELTGGFTSPPRAMDSKTTHLYKVLADCGKELDMNLQWHSSGGVSDANKLSAAGLPVVDTLGPCGGNLHSADEFVLVDTLVPKAKLAMLFLHSAASRQLKFG